MEATKRKIKQVAAGDWFRITRDSMISLNYIYLEHNLQDFGGYQYFNGSDQSNIGTHQNTPDSGRWFLGGKRCDYMCVL